MKKKLLSVILAIAMISSVVATNAVSAAEKKTVEVLVSNCEGEEGNPGGWGPGGGAVSMDTAEKTQGKGSIKATFSKDKPCTFICRTDPKGNSPLPEFWDFSTSKELKLDVYISDAAEFLKNKEQFAVRMGSLPASGDRHNPDVNFYQWGKESIPDGLKDGWNTFTFDMATCPTKDMNGKTELDKITTIKLFFHSKDAFSKEFQVNVDNFRKVMPEIEEMMISNCELPEGASFGWGPGGSNLDTENKSEGKGSFGRDFGPGAPWQSSMIMRTDPKYASDADFIDLTNVKSLKLDFYIADSAEFLKNKEQFAVRIASIPAGGDRHNPDVNFYQWGKESIPDGLKDGWNTFTFDMATCPTKDMNGKTELDKITVLKLFFHSTDAFTKSFAVRVDNLRKTYEITPVSEPAKPAKPDKDAIYLSDCEALMDGSNEIWGPGGGVASINTTEFTENKGSVFVNIKKQDAWRNALRWVCPTTIDLSKQNEIKFDLFVSNAADFMLNTWEIRLSSDGEVGSDFYQWNKSHLGTLKDGWNEVVLKYADAEKGGPCGTLNLEKAKAFKVYCATIGTAEGAQDLKLGIDNLRAFNYQSPIDNSKPAKPDKDAIYLSDCEALMDGTNEIWGPGGGVTSINTTEFTENKSSVFVNIKKQSPWKNAARWLCPTTIDLSAQNAIKFDLFVSNGADFVDLNTWEIRLSNDGELGSDFYQWNKSHLGTLKNGWNEVVLKYADAEKGGPCGTLNLEKVKAFKMLAASSEMDIDAPEIKMGIDNLRAVKVTEEEIPDVTPDVKPDVKPDVPTTSDRDSLIPVLFVLAIAGASILAIKKIKAN